MKGFYAPKAVQYVKYVSFRLHNIGNKLKFLGDDMFNIFIIEANTDGDACLERGN